MFESKMEIRTDGSKYFRLVCAVLLSAVLAFYGVPVAAIASGAQNASKNDIESLGSITKTLDLIEGENTGTLFTSTKDSSAYNWVSSDPTVAVADIATNGEMAADNSSYVIKSSYSITAGFKEGSTEVKLVAADGSDTALASFTVNVSPKAENAVPAMKAASKKAPQAPNAPEKPAGSENALTMNGITYTGVVGTDKLDTILGNAVNFGIIANEWYQSEAETNAAVKKLHASQQTGNDLTNKNAYQPWAVASIEGTMQIKGDVAVDLFSPRDVYAELLKSNPLVGVTYHEASKEDVESYVDSMLQHAEAVSNEMAGKSSFDGTWATPVTDQSAPNATTTNYVLDFTTLGSGTYYVNVDNLLSGWNVSTPWWSGTVQLNDDAIKINKNSDQTIVLNTTLSDVTLRKFTVTNGGARISSDNTTDVSGVLSNAASGIIWNMPNASTVRTAGSVCGVFLAPHATFSVQSTSTGWIVADTVTNLGGQEWHNIWQEHNDNYAKIGAVLAVRKQLENEDLVAGQFSFTISDSEGNVVQTATNDANGYVYFDALSFDKPGTYTYRISEVNDGQSDITYDSVTYDAVVTVAAAQHGKLATSVEYRNAENSTVLSAGDDVCFVNVSSGRRPHEAHGTAKLAITKTLSTGAVPADGAYEFQLIDSSNNVLQTKRNAGSIVSFDALNYSSKDAGAEYTYTIHESSAADAGWTNGDDVAATVKVGTDQGNGELSESVVSYTNDATITNTFKSGAVQLDFDKYFYGDNANTAFTFTVSATDANWNVREGESGAQEGIDDGNGAFEVVGTATNFVDSHTKIEFPKISYFEPGVYHYVVTEDATAGYMTDEAEYLVTVDATDLSDPTISYELRPYAGAEIEKVSADETPAFYNNDVVSSRTGFMSYALGTARTLASKAVVYPEAEKMLVDEQGNKRQLNAGEFTFEIVDAQSGAVLATASNDASGKVAFSEDGNPLPELTYTHEGRWTYLIREQQGSNVAISYDQTVFDMQVTVTSDSGVLKPNVVYHKADSDQALDKPIFVNTYEGADLTVRKVSRLSNPDGSIDGLEDCTYALWMATSAGDVKIGEATSDTSGYITFKDIDLMKGEKCYFKEVKAPLGHTVDPYRSVYFMLNEDGTGIKIIEDTNDGLHNTSHTMSDNVNGGY